MKALRLLSAHSALLLGAIMLITAQPAHAEHEYWQNGNFLNPAPYAGGFDIVDVGVRYGEWRVLGAPGNVAWVNGAYTHDGFNFVGPQGVKENWVNLAGISRSATGIMHSPVATVVGQPYTVSFQVGNISDPSGFYGSSSTVKLYENSAYLGSFTNNTGTGSNKVKWQQFSYTFIADANFTTIAFINGDASNDAACGLARTLFAPATAEEAATASSHFAPRAP